MKIGNKHEDGFVKPPEEETSYADLPEVPGELEALSKREKIKSFYKHLEDNGYIVDKFAYIQHMVRFEFNPTTGRLVAIHDVLNGERADLTYETNSNKFYSPRTIAANYGKGGTQFVRDFLGIKNWDNPIKKIPPKAEASLAKTSETIALTNSSPERSGKHRNANCRNS